MELRGKQLIHAAAVGTEAGAVLITGRSGSGKSTTSLAALRGGLYYLGDDYVVVGLEPEPTVYSLYSTAKLNADQVGNLPEFATHVSNEHALDEEKAVMFLQDVAAQQIRTELPLRAILVPRIQDQIVYRLQHGGTLCYAACRRVHHAVPAALCRTSDLRIPAPAVALVAGLLH